MDSSERFRGTTFAPASSIETKPEAKPSEPPPPLAVDSKAVQNEVHAISPENAPALPVLSHRGIRYLLIGASIVAFGVLLTALIASKLWFMVALLPFLTFSLLLANPEIWVAIFRANERKRIFDESHTHSNTVMAQRAQGIDVEVVHPDRSRRHDRPRH